MSKRSSRVWIGAALLSCAASCSQPRSLPPLPDDSATQKSAWQLAPADAMGGVVIADPAHLLERMRAFKAVLDTGPATRALLQKGMAQAILALGFDPLDEDAWKKAGFDPSGPVGIFAKKDAAEIAFRALDGAKASQTFMHWAPADLQGVDCSASGAMVRCGTTAWPLATDAGHSLWPRVEADVGANVRSMGTLAYAPLDVGPAKELLDKPSNPVTGLRAGYIGVSRASERFVVRMGARVDSAAKLLPYLKPRSTGTLLGLGDGAVSTTRMTFSPDALWAFAKAQSGASLDQMLGMATAATGIDLEKEVVNNLTGEVFMFGYRGDKRGPDGKDRTLMERTGTAFVLGTSDDQKTRHVVDRLSEMGGGAIGMFADTAKAAGFTPSYTTDAGERPVHWFSVDVAPEEAKQIGMSRLELFVTTIPGGLVIGEGRSGYLEMKKRIGHKPSAFLDKLPLPGERELFDGPPLAMWGHVGDAFAQKFDMAQMMPMASLLGPDTVTVLNELMQMGQLLFDVSMALEVSADRAELYYQVTSL